MSSFFYGAMAFGVTYLAVKYGMLAYKRNKMKGKDLSDADWTTQSPGDTGLTLSLPRQLKQVSFKVPPHLREMIEKGMNFKMQEGGVEVAISYTRYAKGADVSLTGAAEGAVENVRNTRGARNVKDKRSPTRVGGKPGIEVFVDLDSAAVGPIKMRNLLLAGDRELWQVIVITGQNNPSGDQIWQRIRKSVEFE